MNKEVEEAKEILKNFIEIHRLTKNDLLTMEDSVSEIRTRAEEKVLNYMEELESGEIKRINLEIARLEYQLVNNISKSVIRDKIEVLKRKSDETEKEWGRDKVWLQLQAKKMVLEEILKEGEK